MKLAVYTFLALLCCLEAVGAEEAKCNDTKTECEDGIIIPAWKPVRNIKSGDKICRALVYFLALFYMFLGVSIIADRFMTAIEVITSKEREVKIKKVTGEEVTVLVRVWNETVSNLSLMALGSSAPEILLSVIEVVGNNFEAGALGPGTIVGSAAFNLYIIVAICIVVVPSIQSKRIKHIYVFWVTAIWSIFAYVWLYLIIAVISEGVVELWEGVVTFMFFPLTVLTSYVADKRMFGFFGEKKVLGAEKKGVFSRPSSSHPARGTAMANSFVTNGDIELQMNKQSVKECQEARAFEEHRMQYIEIFKQLRAQHPEADIETLEALAEQEVLCKGPKSRAFYRIHATRKLVGAGNIMKKRLHEIEAERSRSKSVTVASEYFGIVTASFDPGHYTCMENVGTVYTTVIVSREGIYEPCTVHVDYRTVDGSANAISDYMPTEGTVVFYPNEDKKHIGIEIVDNEMYEEDEHFSVHLLNIRAFKGDDKKGDALQAQFKTPYVATVLIVDNDHAGCFGFENEKTEVAESSGELKLKSFVDKMFATANTSLVVGTKSWKEQFVEAISVDAGDYLGGWLCFTVSIVMIGIMTTFIGDLASHFGCIVGLKDSVTAISIVALGTSVPDTFASKVAAVQDTHADACIVNVTGSNAVNVFLGIGVAWTVAAIYHEINKSTFNVPAGSLGFSVSLFCVGAVVCIAILQLRRYAKSIRGELGGISRWKILSFVIFVSTWIAYLALSTLEAYCVIRGF